MKRAEGNQLSEVCAMRDICCFLSEWYAKIVMGYHALRGIELSPLYEEFLREKNTVVRGLGHPVLFGANTETSRQELSRFDTVSIYHGLPVTPINIYRLFERNHYVLLYPGGVWEALHRKVCLMSPHLC
jgi:hypothetical protein